MAEEQALPLAIRSLIKSQTEEIFATLTITGKELGRVVKKIKDESDLRKKDSQLEYIVNQGFDQIENTIGKYGVEGIRVGIRNDVKFLSNTPLKDFNVGAWNEYMSDTQKLINMTSAQYINERSIKDGKTIKFRLKTVRQGTQRTVENIIRAGFSEGADAFQNAKLIENYIKQDHRKRWVSPYSWERKARGFPFSVPVSDKVPAGAVDFNAFRIARTELVNNYRWKRIDSTKGRSFVIGWAWVLSGSHNVSDICDQEWAAHDEGLGRGVYSNAEEIKNLGHPFCYCDVRTMTVFHEEMRQQFALDFANRFSEEQQQMFLL